MQRARAQRVAGPRLAIDRDVLVHRDEPLRRVAEDHRLLRAPGMRVLVLQPAAREQHARVHQRLDHGLVGVALLALVVDDTLAGETGSVVGEGAVLVDGVGDRGVDAARLQLARIRHPDIEVLAAVAGRGVHEARAGVVGDVIAGQERDHELVSVAGEALQRMGALDRIQRVGRDVTHLLESRDARLLEHAFGERVGEDQKIPHLGPIIGRRVRDLVEAVGDLRRERDGAVAGQRPRRSGPDHDAGIGERAVRRRGDRKLHPHHIGRVVLVLDLGFGERGLLDDAPHHGLGAAIERAVGGELHQFARDLRFRRIAHGGVGMIPVADDAEPLEFLALDVEPVARIGAALLAERDHRGRVAEVGLRLALLAVVLLLDLPFDRQAVAIPARHVVGVVAQHLLALGHEILQDLVQRRSDMDVAVGVGRAVMEHELGAAPRFLAQLPVEADLVPALEHFRLALRQPRAHREFGLRQEQGP